jgi:hypothetical protein
MCWRAGTPSIDHLFDRGFISFEDSGRVIVSPVAHTPSLNRMGVETDHIVNVGPFSEGQRTFLDYHRNAPSSCGRCDETERCHGFAATFLCSHLLRTGPTPQLSWLCGKPPSASSWLPLWLSNPPPIFSAS